MAVVEPSGTVSLSLSLGEISTTTQGLTWTTPYYRLNASSIYVYPSGFGYSASVSSSGMITYTASSATENNTAYLNSIFSGSGALQVTPSGHVPVSASYTPSGATMRTMVIYSSGVSTLVGASGTLGKILLARAACILNKTTPASLSSIFPSATGFSTTIDTQLSSAYKQLFDASGTRAGLLNIISQGSEYMLNASGAATVNMSESWVPGAIVTSSLNLTLTFSRFGTNKLVTFNNIPIAMFLS